MNSIPSCLLRSLRVRFAAILALLGSASALAADSATTTLRPESGHLVVDVRGRPPTVPVFFSATADHAIRVAPAEVTGDIRVRLRLVQGRPEILTLGLSGDGEIWDVSGKQVRDWAVRQPAGPAARRLLDLRLSEPPAEAGSECEVLVRTRLRLATLPATPAVLLLTPGEAVGFASRIAVTTDAAVEARVASAAGLVAAADPLQFQATGDGRLELRLASRGGSSAEAELTGARLEGRVNEAGGFVEFRLFGQLRARKAGARVRLLSGAAALNGRVSGEGWRVELVPAGTGSPSYDLVALREGTAPVDLTFVARIGENGDWRELAFAMPAGAIVPLQLGGIGDGATFRRDAPVVPVAADDAGKWRGYVPADGTVALSWRRQRDAGERTLAFTSAEQTEVRIGAGWLRQSSQVAFRVLQGKLGGVRFRLDGPGEIVGVEGTNLVGWKVLPGDDRSRVLEVQFSRPAEGEAARVNIQSQTALGSWPVRAEPLRITPEGGVRHAGFVRVANSGAVRLEVTDATGLMQLAPGQFPGGAVEAGARQVFIHRFPSANYGYRVLASPIQPEVAVSAILTAELGETVRTLAAAIELDVREAALREWTVRVPADYTIVAVTGAEVADFSGEAGTVDGWRTLRVAFARAVEGRQLVHVRLEKSQSAAAGAWTLPSLQFPGARSVRGHLGVTATAGFRLAPAQAERLVEVPVSAFPQPVAGLQQAWRIRESDWTAGVRIEALGQSVQADVFHLSVLKEGVVTSSVLLNYFVVGAPASEWRIEVPAAIGHLDVIGQNVRRDWRREGDQLIVSLHQPVLGAATLLITFEEPMSARGGRLQPGLVRPLGVQAERGFLQVVSPLQVKHEILRAEGALLKLEPAELPAEFRLLSQAPSLAVYQYTARPFAFEMGVEWYAPGDTVDQVVDFAKLRSQVARDGEVVTEASFFVKTRGSKALRLVLPPGVKLWEARVDRELVHARADGEHTLIPLPARLQPNEPVVVALRVGQAAPADGTSVTLVAPRVATASTVVSEWIVRGDAGRRLVPRGGNAELVQPVLAESGFEWIAARGGAGTGAMLLLALVGLALLRSRSGVAFAAGLSACALAAAAAGLLTAAAMLDRRPLPDELTLAATMIPADGTVTLTLANLAEWRASVVPWGVVAIGAGLGAWMLRGFAGENRAARHVLAVGGLTLVAIGLLAQHGGAVMFFAGVVPALLAGVMVPAWAAWRRTRRAEKESPLPAPGAGGATAASMLALTALLAFGDGGEVRAQGAAAKPRPPGPALKAPTEPRAGRLAAAQSVLQRWHIRGERLFGEAVVTVEGGPGESFLLLQPPAVLTDFAGDGLRVVKVEREGSTAYHVTPEREGVHEARIRFEMPVTDRARPLAVPTGPAAVRRVTIDLDQGGWEFTSPTAMQVVPAVDSAGERSGATVVLGPQPAAEIRLQPRRRDVGAETTQYFVETSNLFVPGPGVVNGIARVNVRPVQGRVAALEITVQAGLTVGDVGRGPVGPWRFDPATRTLHVAIEPAQSAAFQFDVETQLGAGELPFALALEPLRLPGAAGDGGLLALAFGGEAQPEAVRATELTAVSVQDFDSGLLPRPREGAPVATVQQAWRYGPAGGRVELKIAPVVPEVRVTSRQVFSLDDDRLVMSADLRVAITRVGLFKLSFPLPDGLELEALSGPALSQWTEARDGAQRIVTLHLQGRTLGEHAFQLALAGPAPGAQPAWNLPRLVVREATRQSGEVVIVPGKGIRLRPAARERVTQLDPRTVGGQVPGTLAFRLLQEDWALAVGIEALEPWVTAQALEEVTLREGQTLTRLGLRYRVENAAIKQVRVRLPGLSEESARTVRATGSAVSDVVRSGPDLWEVRFQRGVAGETDVQIEFQSLATRPGGVEGITPPELVGARQTTLFVAVRGGGRLELEVGAAPRGWTRVDWAAVPSIVQNRADRSVPALAFRVAEPEAPLPVSVRRHEVAEALKLRVTQGELVTLAAPHGAFLTAVDLKVDVIEKSTLRVRLPAGARLFNTFVNGESRPVVREGEAWLFHVAPQTAGERAATVRLVYAVTIPAAGPVGLTGPSLSVPLENVTWRVVLPPGYQLDHYTGGLRLRDEHQGGLFGEEQYQSLVSSKRATDTQAANQLLQEASRWLQKGEQEKAGEALSRASNSAGLDEASNEDARVQLRALKTQQAVVGLNTRRQRLYLDNRADAVRNETLEQAANLNPFMQGKLTFQPQQLDQLLLGNSAEENTALRGIAARIVDQQLGAEPAPGAIDVTLPERGRVLTFGRSLQVDGAAPLELSLALVKSGRTPWSLAVVLVLAVAGLVAMGGKVGVRE